MFYVQYYHGIVKSDSWLSARNEVCLCPASDLDHNVSLGLEGPNGSFSTDRLDIS